MRMRRIATVFALAMMLAACASGPRVVSSDVRTVTAEGTGAAVLSDAHYRFVPGPSVAGQPAAEQLQALAEPALERVGLVRDEAKANITVQLGARVQAYWVNDWGYGPYGGLSRMTFGFGLSRGGFGLGLGGPLWDPSIPLYISEVSVLMRDEQSGQIVYDTRARHDGPWHNTDRVLAALFVAALQGYPQPPEEVRRVDVPVLPVTEDGPAAADD